MGFTGIGSGNQRIVASVPEHLESPGELIVPQEIIAVSAIEFGVLRAAAQGIVALATIDPRSAEAAQQAVITAAAKQHVRAITAANHGVAKGCADDAFDAAKAVAPCAPGQGEVYIHPGGKCAVVDRVLACAAGKGVSSGSTCEPVITIAAIHDDLAALGSNGVIPGASVHGHDGRLSLQGQGVVEIGSAEIGHALEVLDHAPVEGERLP